MGEVDDTLSPSTSSEASAPESGTEPETTAHPDSSTGSESSPTPESSTGSESSPTAGTATEPEEADAVAAARREAAEYLDHLRRLQAEFDNYRKRVLKEQTQAIELAAGAGLAGFRLLGGRFVEFGRYRLPGLVELLAGGFGRGRVAAL